MRHEKLGMVLVEGSKRRSDVWREYSLPNNIGDETSSNDKYWLPSEDSKVCHVLAVLQHIIHAFVVLTNDSTVQGGLDAMAVEVLSHLSFIHIEDIVVDNSHDTFVVLVHVGQLRVAWVEDAIDKLVRLGDLEAAGAAVAARGGIDSRVGIDGLSLELDHGDKGFDSSGAGHCLDSDWCHF